MAKLREMGEFVRSASSTIEAPVVRRLTEAFAAQQARPAKEPAREAPRAQRPQPAARQARPGAVPPGPGTQKPGGPKPAAPRPGGRSGGRPGGRPGARPGPRPGNNPFSSTATGMGAARPAPPQGPAPAGTGPQGGAPQGAGPHGAGPRPGPPRPGAAGLGQPAGGGRSGTQGAFGRPGGRPSRGRKSKKQRRQEFDNMQAPAIGGVHVPRGNGQVIRLSRGASLADFADKIGANPASLVQVLFHLGEMVTPTQSGNDETLQSLGLELNYNLQVPSPADADPDLLEPFAIYCC